SKLFGMTESGRSGYDDGTIFSIDTNGKGYKDMLNFNYINGEYPYGSLALSSRGKLYGMTQYGGANNAGVLFSIDTSSGTLNDLFSFDATHGSYPQGNNITISGDTLYGMTYQGGFNNYGLIFSYIDTSILSGVNEPTASTGNINIYPNPNNGQFIIQSSAINHPSSIEVYNVLGEKVYASQPLNSKGTTEVNLSSLANGIYVYNIITEDGSLLKQGKIVLEK
ncbi:MAG TPA: choice-of-anchor tandem repeat GloVer-containing protein, partial [Bacteroidia bacterium]|nr:choice-of-anchor tandem repeat GloVer-containing protein [Bacteroidia bacterium]